MKAISYIGINLAAIAVGLLAAMAAGNAVRGREPAFAAERPLRVRIELSNHPDTTGALIAGYNYRLLQEFAAEHGLQADIRKAAPDTAALDSLRRGAWDLLVLPWPQEAADSLVFTAMPDSCAVWAVTARPKSRHKLVHRFLSALPERWDYARTREPFFRIYDPLRVAARGRRLDALGPYDDLIRKYSEGRAWDWRLLAALIFQESRFHIEARSWRGAEGLLQMMPRTARNFGLDNTLDPEESIRAAADYLRHLEYIFRGDADSQEDLQMIVLAAYNAGEGNIKEAIGRAKQYDVPYGTWDYISNHLDYIAQDTYNGDETRVFVERVYAWYEAFCRIVPE
ncbi:MAG: transglycosylase SLT domain-containing protein [Bacteroidales bacterium]|nr:transglycosylase SLT domain-containing protein [Bacteroidales bacterium]